MPNDAIHLRSTLAVAEIARIFQGVLSGRRVKFGKIQNGDDPFTSVEVQPDFSAFASHDKKIGSWAVQLYVFDEGNLRRAELYAVYHSGLSRAWAGTQNTYSRSAGVKKAQEVIGALQSADSSLVIG